MNCAATDTLPHARCEVTAWRHGRAATETVVEEVPVARGQQGPQGDHPDHD